MNDYFRSLLVHHLDDNIRIPIPSKPYISSDEKVHIEKYLDINNGLSVLVSELNISISEGFDDMYIDNSIVVTRIETDIGMFQIDYWVADPDFNQDIND